MALERGASRNNRGRGTGLAFSTSFPEPDRPGRPISAGGALVWLVSALLLMTLGCADDTGPVVEATPLGDSRDPLGPYTVTAKVVDHRGLETVRLYHRDAEAERAEIIVMEEVLDDVYEAPIPGRPSGTTIHWFVEAEDIHGNLGYAPPAAEWGDESCVDALQPDAPVPEGGAAFCFSVLE